MEDRRENGVVEIETPEELIGQPDYEKLIIEMVHNISDIWIKEQIYRCIKNMIKED